MTYPGMVQDITRGVWVMAPASAESRQDALDCELPRHRVDQRAKPLAQPGVVGRLRSALRRARLGNGPGAGPGREGQRRDHPDGASHR